VALILYGQFQTSAQSLPRITEAEDYRITELGDQRITGNTPVNTSYSSIISYPNVIPFKSTYYVKYQGNWKNATVFLKYNGNWVSPVTAHKKENNIWKRVI